MYNKVAPKVIPITVKRSPSHFPKMNPANSAIGAPKPAAKTHRVANKINNRPKKVNLFVLIHKNNFGYSL